MRREATIYLLPECDNLEEALEGLRGDISTIFEEQLNGWYRVPATWPKPRDRRTFLIWFECSFHSMIFDLSRERLRHEEL